MKLSAATLSFFLFTGSATAQYFSAGWSPGQKAKPAADSPANAYVPGQSSVATESASTATPSATANSFLGRLLTSKPAEALFSSFGVNISERLNEKLWDERVQLITDDNYQDVIVNERLTPQQEKDRVWVIIITGQAAKQDEYSKLIDENFDSAYNQSQVAGDLPHVKWGRIDYLNVTRITTKWNIWRAPYLVILTDRGKTLRFYHHLQIRLRDDTLRQFLRTKGHLGTAPWSSPYSPGGEREYILDHFANILTRIYNIAILIPRWLLVVVSGGIGSLIIGLLHRPQKNKQEKKHETKPAVVEAKEEVKAHVAQAVVVPPPPAPKSDDPVPSRKTKPPKSNGIASSSVSAATASTKSPTPVATDSERESAATGPAPKRSSTRQRKNRRA